VDTILITTSAAINQSGSHSNSPLWPQADLLPFCHESHWKKEGELSKSVVFIFAKVYVSSSKNTEFLMINKYPSWSFL
jgi:hypothetical protein